MLSVGTKLGRYEIRAGAASLPQDSLATHQSSAEYVFEGIKRNKKIVFAGLGLIAIAIAGVAFLIYQFVSKPKPHFERVKLARITTEGNLKSVGVSPDGKYVAYSLLANGKYSLWTKHLATGSRVQIVAPVEATNMSPHFFSHDGSYVYYFQQDEQNPQGVLFQVAVLGGDSKKILTNVQSTVALSPDGRQLAFGRYLPAATQQYELWLANADGTNQRKLSTFSEPSYWSGFGLAWSPDSRALVYRDRRGDVSNLWRQPLDGAQPAQITDFKSEIIRYFSYSRDGKQIVMSRGNVTRDAVLITDEK